MVELKMNEENGEMDSHEPNRPLGYIWGVLRFVIAAILVFAVIMKLRAFPLLLAGDGLMSFKPLLLTAIAVETFLAAFLVVGHRASSWWLTVILFSVFIVASAFALATGRSCDCLGLSMGPQAMLLIDISVLISCLIARPFAGLNIRPQVSITGFACLALGTLVAGAAASQATPVADSQGKLDFLLADGMIGKRWPITERYHQELAGMEQGNWLVIVARTDCEHCRELLSKHFSEPTWHREGERTALLIAGSDQWQFAFDQVSFELPNFGLLQWPDGEPFVASPAVFVLQSGSVVDAADGSDSENLLMKLQETL